LSLCPPPVKLNNTNISYISLFACITVLAGGVFVFPALLPAVWFK
jgi:hypothetical protein